MVLDGLAEQTGVEGLHAFHRALILEFSGRTVEAEEAYRNALAVAGVGPRGGDALGRFLRRTGRNDEAEELYRSIIAAMPDATVARAGLAEISAGVIPPSLVSTPAEGAAEGLFSLAASLTGNNNNDVAILYLNLAIYLRPDFDLARALLGDRYERIGKYAKAIDVYSEIAPDSLYYPMLEVQTAINLGRIGEVESAIARLRVLTRRAPEEVDAWTALGDLWREVDENEQAVDAYDRAVALVDDDDERLVDIYFARGVCHQSLGSWEDAEDDFQAALALDPDRADVLNYLGYSWVDQGRNLDEAVALLERARSLRPLDGYIADSVGWAYYRLGRYQEAAEILEQAVQLAPGTSEINDHLGDAYWRIGRRLDARFEWTHALNLEPEPEVRAIIERKLRVGLEAALASDT
jgi:tetratricopeptide (TPR) repeat protein